jgi:hypothetical protein
MERRAAAYAGPDHIMSESLMPVLLVLLVGRR